MSKSKITIKNIVSYIQGNIRYKLFYSKFSWLIPSHIKKQIEIRINSMDKKCYNDGSCKMCGCKTTALQMANKTCDKPCYPGMLNKKKFKRMINTEYIFKDNFMWQYDLKNNKFIKLWKQN